MAAEGPLGWAGWEAAPQGAVSPTPHTRVTWGAVGPGGSRGSLSFPGAD